MPSRSYNSKKGSVSEMLSAVQRRSLEEATARYEAALPGSPAAIYLATRGIDETVARTVRAGYVETPASGHEQMRGMLCLPYLTPSGVVALKFRSISSTSAVSPQRDSAASSAAPKYLIPVGQQTRLFNVLAFREQEHSIGVSEGEIDALTLHHLCGIPAVGIPGVQSWKSWYARCLEGYERVLIFADNDKKESGENPGMELARKILEEVPQAQLVTLPANTDVNALYVQGGRQAVLDLLP